MDTRKRFPRAAKLTATESTAATALHPRAPLKV